MTTFWPILAGVLATLAVLLLARRQAELRPSQPAPRVAVLRPTPPTPGRIIAVRGPRIDENAGPDMSTPDADRLLRQIGVDR